MKKGIVLPFLLLLASVTLILGAFFILNNKQKVTPQNPTQTPQPSPANETINTDQETANWKTHTSTSQLYSFKYPSDWKIKDSESLIISSDAKYYSYYGEIYSGAYFKVFEYTNTNGIHSAPKSLFLDCAEKNLVKNLTINGYKATKWQTSCPSENKDTTKIFVQKDNRVIILIYDYQPRTNDEYRKTIDQILSTFKFTN